MAEKKTTDGFSPAEKAAMKQRAKELQASETAAEALQTVVDKIASLDEPDKTNAQRIHDIILKAVPNVKPRLYYGSPGYANADGKIVCFYQERSKFKVRYGNFAFFEAATLDEGSMWPSAFAVLELSKTDEKRIEEMVTRAFG